MKNHIPNFISVLNIITGGVGCFYLIEEAYAHAVYFVLAAAFFDFLDGFVARLLRVRSELGKQLDSMADLISFGLLPSVYMVMAIRQFTDRPYLPFAGLTIVVFSAVRLAKFNNDTRQLNQFIGLPTPANAIMISALSLLPGTFSFGLGHCLAISVLSSFLLVANVPLMALKFQGFGWGQNKRKYILLMIMATMVFALRLQALPLLVPVYLIVSILSNLTAGNKG